MKKQTLINNLKAIILGVILAAGVSYVAAWNGPCGDPTSCNTSAPINVGSSAQTKTGAFTSMHLFTLDLTVTASDGSSTVTPGSVLTALDNTGKVGWQSAGGGSSTNAQQWGFIAPGSSTQIGSWNRIFLNGQYNSTAGDGSDAGPAGGFIFKDSNGIPRAHIFTGQSDHAEFAITTNDQCSGSGPTALCVKLVGSAVRISTGAYIQVEFVGL